MPVTRAEGLQERAEVLADIEEDGARVTVQFVGTPIDPAVREVLSAPDIRVETFGLISSFSAEEIAAGGIEQGDAQVYVADGGLGGLLNRVSDLGPGGELGGSIFYVYIGGDPEGWPTIGAAGVKTLRVIRLLETIYVGGYPVLHRLQARGASAQQRFLGTGEGDPLLTGEGAQFDIG